MADASTSNTPPVIKDEPNEAFDLENRIIELCEQFPKGVSDAMIQTSVPHITPQQRVQALNRLLSLGRIDLLKVGEQLLYKVRSSDASKVKGGDHQEKLVYQIIEEAGSKGIWIRDIRYKSNLLLTQVNKILKSLESKKLIKAVKSVAASKKKVYMLYNVEPDRSVTGGAWYSDQDFESEFVDVLNQQCFKFLNQKAATAQEAKSDPILQRNSSFASCKEVWKFISELGISKVNLSAEDIETILDTLIFDGKVERILVASTDGQTKLYRAVSPLVMHTGLMKSPCGVCPVISQCSEGALVSPSTCTYMKDWLDL